MAGDDAVVFVNHRAFVQLIALLRSLGVIDLGPKNLLAISKSDVLDAIEFATFAATLAAARWKRELFVFMPYGDRTLLVLAEPSVRARFPVTAGRHATDQIYPGLGVERPAAAACAVRSYFAYNWSVVRTDAFPAPAGCAGGAGCGPECATVQWFRAAELDGDRAAACLGGYGLVLPVPFKILEALYTDVPAMTPDDADSSESAKGGGENGPGVAPTRDTRALQMAPFDAYLTVKLAAALKADNYAPNTYLSQPFESAELDVVAFRRDPPRLAVVETTLSNEEGLPQDQERGTRPLDRLKIKYLQALSMKAIKGVDLRYVYACTGTFAYPAHREWASLFRYVTEQHPDTIKLIALGDKFPVMEELQAGKWDGVRLRAAFDWFIAEIVKQSTT